MFLIVNICPDSVHAKSHYGIQQDSIEASTVLEKAKEYFNLKQYNKAIGLIEKYLPTFVVTAENGILVYLQVELSKNHKRLKNFDASLIHGKQALHLAHKASKYKYLLQGLSLKAIGDLYLTKKTLDSALVYLEKASDAFIKAENWEQAAFCNVGRGTGNFRKGNYKAMGSCLSLALEIADNHLLPENRVYTILFQLFGVLNYKNGDFDQALEIALKSVDLTHKQPKLDTAKLAYSYNNVAAIYAKKGDQGNAIQYYQLALGLHEQQGVNPQEIANTYNNLGLNYLRIGEFDKSIAHLSKSLFILEYPKLLKGRQHYSCLNNIAIGFLEKKAFDSANFYISKVFKLYKQSDTWDGLPHHTMGIMLIEMQDYSNALQQLKKAANWYEQQPTINKYDLAEVYKDLALTYFLMEDFPTALNWVNKTMSILDINNNKEGVALVAEWEKAQSKETLLRILHLEAKIKKQIAQNNNISDTTVLAYFDKTIMLVDFLRTRYKSEYSKLNLSRRVVPIFENSVEVALNLYNNTENEVYFEKAFQLAEKNKGLFLFESIKKLVAKRNGFIPDSLLDLEHKLQVNLSFYQRNIAEGLKKTSNREDGKINFWRDKVLKLNNSIDSLEQVFISEFSEYHYATYNQENIILDQVRQTILNSENEVLVSYLFGEKHIYIFGISRKQLVFDVLPVSAKFNEQLTIFTQQINHPPSSVNAGEGFQNFVKSSHFLYKKLLSNVISKFNVPSIEKLIVIPDHTLNYLPFESLISQIPNSNKTDYSSQNLNYLVNQFNINYAFSTTTLLRNKQSMVITPEKYLAGFAPSFEDEFITANRNCRIGKLYSLRCSNQEINEIINLANGTSFNAYRASKANFVNNASSYGVLHLATHACVDENDPMMNRIYFTDDFVTTYELFSMRLNANMVVLSACDTGSGKLFRGEGVMSLSRGFAYAGCPSLLTSLWSVDDCATSNIMISFYKFLATGISKGEALFKAKNEYLLNQGRSNTHPYYWAAFIHVGDDRPIEFTKSNRSFFLLLIIPFLILLLFFSYQRISKKRQLIGY